MQESPQKHRITAAGYENRKRVHAQFHAFSWHTPDFPVKRARDLLDIALQRQQPGVR
jgi:hypothetical protein